MLHTIKFFGFATAAGCMTNQTTILEPLLPPPSNDALTLLSWRDFGGSSGKKYGPGSTHKFPYTGKRGGEEGKLNPIFYTLCGPILSLFIFNMNTLNELWWFPVERNEQ